MKFRAPRFLGLLLFGFLTVAAWGATYTWTGGGGADTSWTTAANWGGTVPTAADTAVIDGTYTVTLPSNIAITALDFNYNNSNPVTLNLNGHNITVSGSVNFSHDGTNAGAPGNAANVSIIGSGTIAATTLDANQWTTNTINLSNNVVITWSGTFYGDQQPGTTTTFNGDGTSSVYAVGGGTYYSSNGGSGTQSGVVMNDILDSSGYTYNAPTVSAAPAANSYITVTVTGTFAAGLTFKYAPAVTGTESYMLEDSSGGNAVTVTSSTATTAAAFSGFTSSTNSFQFRIVYPSSVASGNGFNLTVISPSGLVIGTINFTQASATTFNWTNGGGDNLWSTAANWDGGQVPSSTSTVTIGSGTPVLTANSSAASVTVASGASLDLAGFNLTGVSTFTNNGTVRIKGTEAVISGTKINGASSTVEYYGTTTSPGWGTSYQNLTVSAGTLPLTAASYTVAGALTNAGTVAVGSRSLAFGTYSGAGAVSTTSGTLTASGTGGTIATLNVTTGATINGGTTGLIISNNLTGNLTTSNVVTLHGTSIGSVTNTGTLKLNGALTLSGSLAAGSLDMNGNAITMSGGGNLSGTVTNSGAAAGFTASGAVTLTGATSITTGNGAIGFSSTVNGGNALSLAAGTGAVTFGGAVGGTALTSLTVTSSGSTSLNAVTTTGAQSYTGTTITTNGALTTTSTASAGLTFAGAVVLGGNTVFNTSATNGNVTTSSTLDATTSGSQTLGVQLGAGTWTASGAVGGTPLGTLTRTSGAIAMGSNPLTVAGDVVYAAGTLTSSGTVTLDGSAQAVNFTGATLANLTVNSSGTVTAGSAVTLSGNLTRTTGALAMGTFALNVAGNITYAAGTLLTSSGTVTLNGSAQAVDFTGATLANLTVNSGGTVTAGSDITLSSGGVLTLTAGTLDLNGKVFTLGSNLALSTTATLSVNGGTLAGASYNLTQSNGTLSLGTSGTVNITDWTQSGGTFNGGTGAVNASGNVAITAGTLTAGTSTLTMTGSGKTLRVSTAGSLDNLTIGAAGAVSVSTSALTVGGNLNVAGSFSNGANAVTVTGTADGAGTFGVGSGNMTFSSTYGATTPGGTFNVTSTGALTFTGAATLTSGSMTGTGTGNIVFLSDATFSSSLSLTQGTDPIVFQGTAAQAFTTGGLATYKTLTVNKAAGAVTVSGSLTAVTLNVTSGTLSLPTSADTITVPASGSTTVGGGTLALVGAYAGAATSSFTLSSGTVTVATAGFTTGTYSQSGGTFIQTGTNTAGSQSLASISQTAGTMTWDSTSLGGDLTISTSVSAAGTLSFNRKNVQIGGTISGNLSFYDLEIPSGKTLTPAGTSTITVLRNFTIDNGGTYTAGSATLVMGSASGFAGTITDSNATLQNLGILNIDTQTVAMGSNLKATTLSVTNNGVLSDGGTRSLTVSGTTTATTNTLSWSSASNSFGGAVSITSANGVTLYGGAVTFGAVTATAGNFAVISSGLITLSGTVSSSGYTSLNGAGVTQSGGTLTATGGLELLGTGTFSLTRNNPTPSLAANVTGSLSFTSTTALALQTVNATSTVSTGTASTLTLTSGALTQSVPISTGTLILTSSGAITLANASNSVTTLGAVSRAGAFQLVNNRAAGLTVTGNVNTGTTSNSVSISNTSGPLAVNGTTIASTGAANSISLSATGVTSTGATAVNAGAGSITVNAGGGAIGLASSTLTSTNAVTLRNATTIAMPNVTGSPAPALTIGVSTDVTGAVTQTGTTIAAASLTGTTAGAITLTSANTIPVLSALTTGGATQITTGGALTVSGAVSTGGSDLTLVSATGLTIGAAGSVSVGTASVRINNTTSGTITQTGTITAAGLQLAGAGTFTLNAANSVGTFAANTTGAVALTTTAASFVLGSVTTNATTTNGVSTGSGAVSLTTSSGTTTQTAAITTTGGLALLGTGTYTLTNTSNSVAVLAGSLTGSASVYSLGAVSVGTVGSTVGWTSTGNLTLNGTGAWTNAQPLSVAGLELRGAGPYTFTGANTVATLAGNVTNAVSLSDSAALVIGTVNTVGLTSPTVTLTSAGLSQSALLSVSGTLTLTDTTNAVDLLTNGASNVFGTVDIVSAGTTSLTALAAYTLYGTVSGNLTVNGSGDLTIPASQVLQSTGTAIQTLSPTGNIIVNGQVQTANGAVSFSPSGASSYTSLNHTTTAAVSSSGSGGLSFTKPVVLTVNAILTATTGNVTFGAGATVDGTAGTETLTVNTGTGQTTFNANVGVIKTLGTLLATSSSQAAGVTFAQQVKVAAGSQVQVVNGGAINVQGAVSAPSGFSVAGTGAIAVSGSVTTNAGAVTMDSSGSTVSLSAAVNTSSGSVSIDSASGTTITAAGDITSTGASAINIGQNRTGSLTTAGDITTVGGAVQWYNAATLSGAVQVSTGTAGANFTASGTVTGAGNTLTLSTGTAGQILFSSADGLPLVVVQSNGLTSSGTWGSTTPESVTITDTQNGKTVSFAGTVTNISTLTASATSNAYNVQITGSAANSTIGTASLPFTGTLTLGGANTADITFTNGLTHTAGPTSAQGTVAVSTASDVQSYGSLTLIGNTTLTTSNGNITAAAINGGSFNLTLGANGGGTFTVSGAVTNLGSGTGASFTAPNGVTGLVKFGGTLTAAEGLSFGTSTNVEFDADVTISGTGTATASSFGASGTVTFAKTAAQNFSSNRNVTFSGAVSSTGTNGLTVGPSTAATLITVTQPAGTWTVGAGGLTITANYTGTGATLAGASGQDATFSTPTGSNSTVTLGTYTHNSGRMVFNAAAGRTIVLNPNNQTFADVLVGNGVNTVVSMTNGQFNLGASHTLTVASGSTLNLATSVAYGGTLYGLFLGNAAAIVNNGTTNIATATTGNAPVSIGGSSNNGATWSGNGPTWTTPGDVVFTSITFASASAITQSNGSATLYLGDQYVTFADLTLSGTLSGNGYPTSAVSYNATFDGNFNYSAGTLAGLGNANPTTSQTGSVFWFKNTVPVTLTGALGTGKSLYHLAIDGSASVTVSGNLQLQGDLGQITTSSSLDLTNQHVFLQGSLKLQAATTVTSSTVTFAPTSTAQISAPGIPLNVVVLDSTGGSAVGVQQLSAVSAAYLIAFRGNWNTNGNDLSLTDLIAYGVGYSTDNDAEYNGSVPGNTRLAYPWAAYLPNFLSGGAVSGVTNWQARAASTPFGLAASPVGAAETANFTFTTGDNLDISRNFYDHGATMSGAGVWNLNLTTTKWQTAALNSTVSTKWFGEPFAVAIATQASAMNIANSNASQLVAAAQTSAATFTTSGNTNWDTTRPDITSASTRFDNLVEITFTKPLKNAKGEVLTAVGSTTATDYVRFKSGGAKADTLWSFSLGTLGVANSEYKATQITAATDDATSTYSFRTTDSAWNTDATGTSVGGASSTDRAGTNHTAATDIPDITIAKWRLYDASGNPLLNYDPAAGNRKGAATGADTTTAAARYTATADKARPVLVKITTGQQTKATGTSGPTLTDDGHNYFNLQWSEPVNLDSSAVTGINTAGSYGSQLAATLAFGDAYSPYPNSTNTVNVAGLFNYSGTLYRSTRTWGLANAYNVTSSANDPTSSQNDASKVSNALTRTSLYDLKVSIAGYSSGSGTSMYWDGFWWGTTADPSGNYSVPYNANITDAGGNPIDDANVSWGYLGGADPKTGFTLAKTLNATHPVASWEYDDPEFAPYLPAGVPSGTYEVADIADSSGNIASFQFHLLSNMVNAAAAWTNSDTQHPDTDSTRFGIRSTSMGANNGSPTFVNGIYFRKINGTYTNGYNSSSGSFPFMNLRSVDNYVFDGGTTTAPTVTDYDWNYFTVSLAGLPANTWVSTDQFQMSYYQFAAMLTNKAGKLVPTVLDLRCLDLTPPRVVLTLTGRNFTKLYVQLSRPSSTTVFPNLFTLNNSSYTISGVRLLGTGATTSSFQELMLTVTPAISENDLAALRLSPVANAIKAVNSFADSAVSYPATQVAIDMVTPVWASDGSGGQSNPTGTARVIQDFAGGSYLTANDIDLQAKVFGTPSLSLPLRLYYDTDVPSTVLNNQLWLPSTIYSAVSGVMPTKGDSGARYVDLYSTASGGALRNFIIPGSDPAIKTGKTVQFVFRLGSQFAVRSLDPADPRQLAPYEFSLKSVKTQKNGVTILHNVINPTQGQEVELLYTMKKSGIATVQVFALDGSLVKVLHRGRQSAGDYSLFWNGRNEGGNVVARGIYFLRVVAPDTDETRSILVIK